MASFSLFLYHHNFDQLLGHQKNDILHPGTCSGGSIQLTFYLIISLGLALCTSPLFLYVAAHHQIVK
jgi:hypothetical protein